MPHVEVERKWRLTGPPDFALHPPERTDALQQAYVLTSPGELRVRRVGDRHVLTVKGEGTLTRGEWETDIPAWVFEQLAAGVDAVVAKTRHVAWDGEVRLEIDVYEGQHAGLCTVEAEWAVGVDDGADESTQRAAVTAAEEAARAYVLPPWLGEARDVTDDPTYKNKRLAVDGVPAR